MSDITKEEKLNQLEHPNWDILDKSGMLLIGYVQVDNKVLRMIIAECGLTAAMLYVIILSHRNNKTNNCFPTRELLSREINKDIKTVGRNIKLLSDKGYIIVNSGNSKSANEYFFPFEKSYVETTDVGPEERIVKAKKNKSAQNKSNTVETQDVSAAITSIPAVATKQPPVQQPAHKYASPNQDPDSEYYDY